MIKKKKKPLWFDEYRYNDNSVSTVEVTGYSIIISLEDLT